MHLRSPREVGAGALEAGARRTRLVARGVGTGGEVNAHFAHGKVKNWFRWLIERDHAVTRRDALPRFAAGRAARGRIRLCWPA